MALRLGAVAFGLAILAGVEIVLRIADVGRPADHEDPFVGFRSVTPLFVPSEDGSRLEIAPSRHSFFRPDSFSTTKGPTELRIFCLGGSTVQGRPFSIETSFTTWLELALAAAAPDREVDVVNCGGISYASYRLGPILDEVLRYSPDLIVLYTGHNEFLEDRTYEHIKEMPEALARPLELCSRLRTFVVIREAILGVTGRSKSAPDEGRPVLPVDVDARLDHRGGLDQYHRDEKWRRDVIAHYAHAVRRMVETCRDAGVPLILVNPVSNLRDCAPFKSEHRDGITAAELERWEGLVAEARSVWRSDGRRAVALLREAISIDGEYAAIHFDLAKCLDTLGDHRAAREAYARALDLDVCPLRMLEPMHDALLETARQTGTPLVDARKLISDLSDDGMPGSYWLIDHVHPSILGHRKIAEALAAKIVELGLVDPADGWEERRRELFEAHFASLDDVYFARGISRLEAVRGWARGEAGRHEAESVEDAVTGDAPATLAPRRKPPGGR